MVQTVINRGSRVRPTKKEHKEEAPATTFGFWNLSLELQAIKTILAPSNEWAERLFSACRQDHFHHNTTKAIFARLKEVMDASKGYELPSLDFMLSDSKLSPSIKQTLRDSFENDMEEPLATIASQGDFDMLTQELNSLAKTRAVFKATQKAANDLLDSQEPSGLVQEVSTTLGASLFNNDDDDDFQTQIVMGKGYNQAAEDSFTRILSGVFEGSKIKTGFAEFDEKTGGFYRTNLIVVAATSGGGKCVAASTKIPTSRGLKRIEDIYNEIPGNDTDGWKLVPSGFEFYVATRQGPQIVDRVYKTEGIARKITTSWGDTLEGLDTHKIWVYDSITNEEGFKSLGDIGEGDWLLKSIGSNLYASDIPDLSYTPRQYAAGRLIDDVGRFPSKLNEDLAALFGFIVAEGWESHTFGNSDYDLMVFVQKTLENEFGCIREIKSYKDRDYHEIKFLAILSDFFAEFCGKVKSGERFVPKCILQSPERYQRAFLSALFEGDGTVYRVSEGKDAFKNRWRLEYNTISGRLAADVKAVLENMGIACTLDSYGTWAANGSEAQVSKTGWVLSILKPSVRDFRARVGFMSQRKRTMLNEYCDHLDKVYTEGFDEQNTNHKVFGVENKIPVEPIISYINRVFELMVGQTILVHNTSRGLPTSYRKPAGKYHALFSCHGSVQKALKKGVTNKQAVKEIINSHHGHASLVRITNEWVPVDTQICDLIENDIVLKQLRIKINSLVSGMWAQATLVEKIDAVVPVYDLSVPGPHEYDANGLVSHNSLFAVNLLIRQFLLGYKVVLISYEMSEDEVMIRLLSNIAEVDMNRLQNKQITPEEMDRVTAAWREFNLRGYELGSSYFLVCPKKETTIPEVGFRIRGMKPDVTILDYINLLESSTEGDQWQRLGDIAKEAKILANKLDSVMILLAQLDDAYNLRYSKAIKDHANFLMGWVRDETAIQSRVITIRQLKARNAPLYPFDLIERFDIAQFRDPSQDDRTVWPSKKELLDLEIRCQQVGLKLEPTISKDLDKKAKKKTRVKEKEKEPKEVLPVKRKSLEDVVGDEVTERSEDSPIDFSKIKVKSSDASLLKSNSAFEGTV